MIKVGDRVIYLNDNNQYTVEKDYGNGVYDIGAKDSFVTEVSATQLKFAPIKVLDDGFVELVDVMGNDSAIVQAARVSYGTGTKTPSDDRTLIRYLMRHSHTTPFEMVEFKFHVRVPMDCWRQWIRHRTANVNEYSTRYSEAIDSAQKVTTWRPQSVSNKQGSDSGVLDWPEGTQFLYLEPGKVGGFELPDGSRVLGWGPKDLQSHLQAQEKAFLETARQVYEQRIKLGVAREQARKDLPLSTYTEAYWKIDLHNLFHFLRLRLDSHAQLEIRQYAEAMATLVKPHIPLAWEAFEDYKLNSITLSALEIEAIRGLPCRINNKREQQEFDTKIERLGL